MQKNVKAYKFPCVGMESQHTPCTVNRTFCVMQS
uniref:Uncharacterized protein n=1 Tax=Arundo donax TaxID=35708 RepID=A0A0A9EYA1_ARUDO